MIISILKNAGAIVAIIFLATGVVKAQDDDTMLLFLPAILGSASSDQVNPTEGLDLNGTDWTGYLDIQDNRYSGFQAISARIDQSGSSVVITTSSTQYYGRQFSGTITASGYMLMYDSVTGEDWTTHLGNATSTKVDLYDYVNNFDDLDRMYLSR